MRVLITGAGGQLAHDLARVFADSDVVALDRSGLDIASSEQVERTVRDVKPDVVLNPAAYNHVDRAEDEPEAAFRANAVGPTRLAETCERHRALLVHYSTDYVFDGERRTPYPENALVRPVSVYGISKVAGEMAVRAKTDRHLIIRTTGLFGLGGRLTARGNFVETMLRVGASGQPITVVADQVLTPTSTRDLADTTRRLVLAEARGTFHVTNSDCCSWYQFAQEIFRLAGMCVDLRPVAQRDRPMPARRPAYSVLAHKGLLRLGFPDLPSWQEALASYLGMRD